MNETRDLKERAFHDAWAAETPSSAVRVFDAFEHITAQENRFIRGLMGDIRGLRILDVGAGFGESSVYFACQGAKVTANDISPVMLARCAELAGQYGVGVSPLLSPAGRFEFGEGRFDIVYGANVLHHVGDTRSFLAAVKRALVPGGRFFFFDPLAYNPVINVYRRLATAVRTEDEHPLRLADLKMLEEIFGEVRHREFWLATLLLFVKYFLIDRVHPNEDRYWKRILREDPRRIGWWFRPLLRLDGLLLRLPLVRNLAWNTVVWGGVGAAPRTSSAASSRQKIPGINR